MVKRESKASAKSAPRKKRTSTRTAPVKVVIDGFEPKRRVVKKTIHLTEQHAYRLQVLAAMSSLNGRERNQSGIVEEALELWFEANELPSEFEVKLKTE